MKIYLSAHGLLVIEDGASYKSFAHDDGSPFRVEKSGNFITVRQLAEKIAGPALYTDILKSDGSASGANVQASVNYIEGLITTSES